MRDATPANAAAPGTAALRRSGGTPAVPGGAASAPDPTAVPAAMREVGRPGSASYCASPPGTRSPERLQLQRGMVGGLGVRGQGLLRTVGDEVQRVHGDLIAVESGIGIAALAVTATLGAARIAPLRRRFREERLLPGHLSQIIECIRKLKAAGAEGSARGKNTLLCLARALVRDPRIVFLDEATNWLDRRSQAALMEGSAARPRPGSSSPTGSRRSARRTASTCSRPGRRSRSGATTSSPMPTARSAIWCADRWRDPGARDHRSANRDATTSKGR